MPFFFGTPEIARQTFTNVRTTAQPTLEGLSVTFTSHPNYGNHRNARSYSRQDGAQRPLYYRLAFPRLLAEAGFRTIFLRSASRFYAHENIVFGDLGFERVVGREDFFARPELRRYIAGWGLEDRLLYRELVALLEEHREEKIFVTVLGTDTHPPDGRVKFRNLDYPPLPDGFVEAYGARTSRFLTAIHHLDFDIGNAIEALRDASLFDEQTLIILTADHACPFNPAVRALPGYPKTSMARIPVVLLSGQPLPETDFGTRGSQLDLAPTIFHLLGLEVPPGWWGDSLLAPDRRETYVGFDRSTLVVEHAEEATVVNLRNPPASGARLVDLFNTIIVIPR
jgi:phosphoglycerol transferase MdoB-like AlkP superfamily enzyme